MMDPRAAHAFARFGLGRKGGEPPPDDPLAWATGQLDGPDPAPGGPTCRDGLEALRMERQMPTPPDRPGRPALLERADAAASTAWWIDTPVPFRERLVIFWTNHFCVSRRKGEITALAGAYVREAIRPHVTGRFADMLLAVMRHPAMLLYLDNHESVGPRSEFGARETRLGRPRGINENLARECLELHTLSPASGYTQRDVTEFAKVITGWSVELIHDDLGFKFRADAHEPGDKTCLGRTFPTGEAGGSAALAWLGTQPWTYRHLATKLVRHFIADEPPAPAVRAVEAALLRSGGDLKQAVRALLDLSGAWTPEVKLRTPLDHAVAALRALDLPAGSRPDPVHAMQVLGQPWMAAPLPNGWGDTAADWAGGDALLRRVDWAWQIAGKAAADREPGAVAETSLGPSLTEATRSRVRAAGSRRDGLALLLASPEFMRR